MNTYLLDLFAPLGSPLVEYKDPKNLIPSEVTRIGGGGGNYETVAVDNRNPSQPIFYVTEDLQSGALRRYIPPNTAVNWTSLTVPGGTRLYLNFTSTTRFGWTTNKAQAQTSQSAYYPHVEGIDFYNGHLYFVSKTLKKVFVLDVDNGNYTSFATNNWGNPMPGGGTFNFQPDQIVRNGDYLYFTEDGGSTAGVYATHKSSGVKYAVFEAISNFYRNDETTGLAFSPDGKKMYAAFQDCVYLNLCLSSNDCGCLFEFTRMDDQSFNGSTISLKFHNPNAPMTLF
jgi:hypothetical protein